MQNPRFKWHSHTKGDFYKAGNNLTYEKRIFQVKIDIERQNVIRTATWMNLEDITPSEAKKGDTRPHTE